MEFRAEQSSWIEYLKILFIYSINNFFFCAFVQLWLQNSLSILSDSLAQKKRNLLFFPTYTHLNAHTVK